jgi:hypothetical protein
MLWPVATFPIDCSGTSIRKRRTDVRTIVAIFVFGALGLMYSPTSATLSETYPLIGALTYVSLTAFSAAETCASAAPTAERAARTPASAVET